MRQSRDIKQFFRNIKTGYLEDQQDKQIERKQHIKRSGKYFQLSDVEQFSGFLKLIIGTIRWSQKYTIQPIVNQLTPSNLFQFLTTGSLIVAVFMFFEHRDESREQTIYEAWNISNSTKNKTSEVIILALERLNRENYNLFGIDASNTDLKKIDLEEANLKQINLRKANLKKANLKRANLLRADLKKTKLQFANLEEALLMKADLEKANLTLTNLKRSDLWGANLSGANLSGANLREADLTGADLTGVSLIGADLTGARLRRANLTGANLTGANLTNTEFKGANLNSANLETSNLAKTNLKDLKLGSFNSKTIFPKNFRSEVKGMMKAQSLIQNTDNHAVWWGALVDSNKNKTDLRYEVSFKEDSLNIILAPYGITPIYLENIEFTGAELLFSLPVQELLQCELQRQINSKYVGQCHNAQNKVLKIKMAPSFREKPLKGAKLAPTQTDLQILQRALEILHDESVWHKNDERVCDDDEKRGSWSMFCALYQASLDVTSQYLHQRPAMKEVRRIIQEITKDRPFEHGIRDYNNLPETTFEEVSNVLEIAKERISKKAR